MILTLKVIFNRQSPYNPTAAETDESHQRMLVEREKHYIYGHCFSGRATHCCFLPWNIVGADDTLALSLATRACGREMCRFLFRFAVNKTFAIGCTAVGIISDSLVTRCVPARTNTYPSVVTAVRSGIPRGSAIVYFTRAPALAGILGGDDHQDGRVWGFCFLARFVEISFYRHKHTHMHTLPKSKRNKPNTATVRSA